MYKYKYPHMAVTVDIVLLSTRRGQESVLLIKRKNAPFKDQWALPGGYVDMQETALQAAQRELAEETGVENVKLSFAGYFDAIDRDPRERTLSIAFKGRIASSRVLAAAGDDAAEVGWFALSDLPELAFDHRLILKQAVAGTMRTKQKAP